MKSAKSNSTTTDTIQNASAAQAEPTQTESKATMPVIPSSAPDVEAQGPAPSPAPDIEEERNDSLLYIFLLQRIQKMILSYGETEQKALQNFYSTLETIHTTLLKVIAFEKVRLSNVDYDRLAWEFEDLILPVKPIDFDWKEGHYIVYTAKQVAGFFVSEITGFKEPDYNKLESKRLKLSSDFTIILQTIIRGDTLRNVQEIQSMSRPLNDILEAIFVYKSLVEPDEHIPGPEKAAA
ncbi:hypothetical protein [Xanthocytophaga flavus]|nr:hypothetical protein [Xanthocytophaga flavus]